MSCSASVVSTVGGMPASRYHANRIGSLALSRFLGVAIRDTQCGFRLFKVDALRGLRLRARGYDIETEMLVKLKRRGGRIAASDHGRVRRPAQQAEAGARHDEDLFSRGVLPLSGATLTIDPGRTAAVPRRWTVHGLNSGAIFAATYHGVRILPTSLCYAIGHVGAWIAWQMMPASNAALADNLRAVFTDEPEDRLRRRALDIYRSYTRDAIDFLKAVSADDALAQQMFEIDPDRLAKLQALHAAGRGIILVTGHYGNWEAGAVMMTRFLRLPLTIVAMREANPT